MKRQEIEKYALQQFENTIVLAEFNPDKWQYEKKIECLCRNFSHEYNFLKFVTADGKVYLADVYKDEEITRVYPVVNKEDFCDILDNDLALIKQKDDYFAAKKGKYEYLGPRLKLKSGEFWVFYNKDTQKVYALNRYISPDRTQENMDKWEPMFLKLDEYENICGIEIVGEKVSLKKGNGKKISIKLTNFR